LIRFCINYIFLDIFLADENELHRLIVTTTGEIQNISNKIFIPQVVENQKMWTSNENVTHKVKQSVKKQVEEFIRQSSPIFHEKNTFQHQPVSMIKPVSMERQSACH